MNSNRIAIISSHPIQYYAPWFRDIAEQPEVELRVFYLWDFGVKETMDRSFNRALQWDIPLLDGYQSTFVRNVSANPGTHRFFGLRNPDLTQLVDDFAPATVMMIGYNNAAMARFVALRSRRYAIILRGDSHRLVAPPSIRATARRVILQRWFKRYAGFMYVGEANRQYYQLHGVGASRLTFAPHAVDNDRFHAADRDAAALFRHELGIPPHHRVILFAGKLEEKKRPLDLLRAFRSAGLVDTSLLFVGNGAQEESVKAEAAGDSRVCFADFQNQTLMPRTYAAADVFVLPSFGASETWGLAVNEAMAVGLPVIVSSHVGCAADLVDSGRNGLIFEAGNVQALVAALLSAFSDSERLTTWGHHSQEIIRRYSYAAATRGLLAAHRRALVSFPR